MMKRNKVKAFLFVLALLASLIPQIHPAKVAAGGDVDISEYTFPDSNFREYVRKFDKNSNGILEWAELEEVTWIYCQDLGIDDLSGIEFFTRLTILDCSKNRLTSLDVSCNVELERLHCNSNWLTDLDLFYNDRLNRYWVDFSDQYSSEAVYSSLNGRRVQFDLSTIPGIDITRITNLRQNNGSPLPPGSIYNSTTGILEMDHWAYVPGILYDCNVRFPGIPDWRMTVEVHLEYAHYGNDVYLTVERGEGKITVNKQYFVMEGETVTVQVAPISGYVLDSIRVEDGFGNVVPMWGNRFFMPDSTAWVYARFTPEGENPALWLAVFRVGDKSNYTAGETVPLAARAEGGKAPYRYQFYVIRSNGDMVILRDYAYNNTFNWQPVTPDVYRVGVNIRDAAGNVVGQEQTVDVNPSTVDPLKMAVFRTGNRTSYNTGETVALAARAEDGTAPYRYQFYVIRSNGSRVTLRNYSYTNIFNWVPLTPDTYQVGVNAKDAAGRIVNQVKTVTVRRPAVEPLKVAVFRAGYKSEYTTGETVALAARGEGGTAPYRYQFYVYRSSGAKVTLRDYSGVNIFNWKPTTPDTYRVCVAIKDAEGKVITKAIYVKIK